MTDFTPENAFPRAWVWHLGPAARAHGAGFSPLLLLSQWTTAFRSVPSASSSTAPGSVRAGQGPAGFDFPRTAQAASEEVEELPANCRKDVLKRTVERVTSIQGAAGPSTRGFTR